MYKIYGTDDKILIMDSYGKGRYVMQRTKNYTDFEKVPEEEYFLDFSPRHGSVLAISEAEYERLLKHFGW